MPALALRPRVNGVGTTVQVGGLARTDAVGGFEAEFATLAAVLRSAHEQAARVLSVVGPASTAWQRPAASTTTTRGRVRGMTVNVALGHVSNAFLIAALVIYSLSVVAFAGDFAFGRPRRAAAAAHGQARDRAAALASVGAAGAAGATADQAPAHAPATATGGRWARGRRRNDARACRARAARDPRGRAVGRGGSGVRRVRGGGAHHGRRHPRAGGPPRALGRCTSSSPP